ncbi:DUF58 domain-containing protein [Lujinxingia vulgaris]|uniref:DUF58 domain-containing protein n=1 Tax=Lujinxingia vulgaris TaxID=2600176 RepID=A0A5C6XC01_9DELT|nr:DUF58 domain-containing protein [Lujinxingia vulgaris]TXD36277.1 DUF58 domain-containing protein [Lujinxingia vulgaris]
MSPYLTPSGKWLFASGALFTIFGALAREPVLVLLGQVPWWVLLGAMMLILTQSRALQRRQVVLGVDGAPGPLRIRYGQRHTLPISVSNASGDRLGALALEPVTSGGILVQRGPTLGGLAPGHKVSVPVVLTTQHVGRASLQGFEVVLRGRLGLVETRDYLPCVQVLEVFPKLMRGAQRRARARLASAARPRRAVALSAASGTDLRELRDYQPGDPLRTVAWKATVRQRRLISREFDDERTHRRLFALDISTSMRSGTPPGRKFDEVIHHVVEQARDALERGDEVALLTFDHAIFGRVDAGSGAPHLQRMLRHLVGLRSIVDAGRTAWDEAAVERFIADYLLIQERLDFRRQQGLEAAVDTRLLRRWLRAQLPWELARWASDAESHGVIASQVSDARRFARLRGLELPPPSEMRAGTKVSGLQAVFEEALKMGRGPLQLVIYSDLCGLNEVDALERYVRLARRRGVDARVVAPFTPAFGVEDIPFEAHYERVREIFSIAEADDRALIASRVEALGVPVALVGPDALRGEGVL